MPPKADCVNSIKYACTFLLEREKRLVNARRNAVDKDLVQTQSLDNSNGSPFQRNGAKRRSLNLSSISSMFSRRPSQIETSMQMVAASDEVQQKYLYPQHTEAQHIALSAVLLNEWVKELAALAQEHTIAQLASLFK